MRHKMETYLGVVKQKFNMNGIEKNLPKIRLDS